MRQKRPGVEKQVACSSPIETIAVQSDAGGGGELYVHVIAVEVKFVVAGA